MFTKEEFIPQEANRWLFIAAPAIAMVGALMTSVVIPWAHPILVNGLEFKFQAADLNIGVLYVFGVVSLGVYGVMLGGWSSNNKYALMAAVRSSSQMISYEIAMGLAMLAILMSSGSLSLNDIVEQQSGMRWNVFYQPLAFLIFLVCSFAESNRMPFDLPESESELVGGYHTEYSSMKLGLFLFSEYVHMFISSAIISTLFFGGYSYPGMDWMANHFPIWATALITVQYPEVKRDIAAIWRGRHVLKRDDEGRERCTACGLCALACPAEAITMVAAERTADQRHLYREEKYAAVYEIDMIRCIYCGLCEEACPKEAIFLTPELTKPETDRQKFIYGKDVLVERMDQRID
ncbi:unnamed protein product, partial [Notodromas monacha]